MSKPAGWALQLASVVSWCKLGGGNVPTPLGGHHGAARVPKASCPPHCGCDLTFLCSPWDSSPWQGGSCPLGSPCPRLLPPCVTEPLRTRSPGPGRWRQEPHQPLFLFCLFWCQFINFENLIRILQPSPPSTLLGRILAVSELSLRPPVSPSLAIWVHLPPLPANPTPFYVAKAPRSPANGR